MIDFECRSWQIDAPLTGVSVDRGGTLAAFAAGDGRLRIASLPPSPELDIRPLAEGAILSLTPDCEAGAFLAGADDGGVYCVTAHDEGRRLFQLPRAWPDQLATHPAGLRAMGNGPDIQLLDSSGEDIGVMGGHRSTVAGLAFDRDGRQLAASHYDGASVWDISTQSQTKALHFRGSHLGLSWHTAGRFVVTTTQEKMLHAWDLQTDANVSLGPCFNKVKTLGWSADGDWLIASGNDTVSAWEFSNNRLPLPPPKMLGRFSEQLVGQVCPHPQLPLTAVGYKDGGLELTLISARSEHFALLAPPAPAAVALDWSPSGHYLVGGDQNGRLFVYRFDTDSLARLIEGS
ncbi:MAG: WD40 repeat domain-containing protein [Pseudomonadota bacterium]